MNTDVLPLYTGLLVMLRFVGLILTTPLLGFEAVPMGLRLLLGPVLAIAITPSVTAHPALPADLLGLGLAGIAEIGLGCSVGMVVSVFFHAARVAGQWLDIEAGLSFASLVDPAMGEQGSILANFLGLFSLAVILAADGHHVLIAGLARSFTALPVGTANLALGDLFLEVTRTGADLLATGLCLVAPAMVALLVVKVGLGLLARAAPQINVLSVGFIVTIAVGFATLALSLPAVGEGIRVAFERSVERAFALTLSL